MQMITPELVRASINRARRSLEAAASEIVWQIEMEAWRTLGYASWSAMREAEYGGAAFMVPSKNRPELVARIRAAGLTQQEIADTAGVSEPTVRRDLSQSSFDDSPTTIINSRGEHRPATYARAEAADDVIDADVIEDGHVNNGTGTSRSHHQSHMPNVWRYGKGYAMKTKIYTAADIAEAWSSGYWNGTGHAGPLNDAAVRAKNPHLAEANDE